MFLHWWSVDRTPLTSCLIQFPEFLQARGQQAGLTDMSAGPTEPSERVLGTLSIPTLPGGAGLGLRGAYLPVAQEGLLGLV